MDAEIVESPPRRRAGVLLALLALAVVAAVVVARVAARPDPPRPADRPYLEVPAAAGYQSSLFDGEHGYLTTLRNVWSAPVEVRSVVPLDAAGGAAPHRLAAVASSPVAAQQLLYDPPLSPPPPVTVVAGAEVELALRLPANCPAAARVVAVRVTLLAGGREVAQVVPLGRHEALLAERAARLCPGRG